MPIDPHRALTAYVRAQSYTVPPQRIRPPVSEVREAYPGAPDPAPAPPTPPPPVLAPAPDPVPIPVPAETPDPVRVRAGLLARLLGRWRRGLALR